MKTRVGSPVWIITLLLIASCTSDVPTEVSERTDAVSWDDSKQGTVVERLPQLDQIASVTLTSWRTTDAEISRVLPPDDWPVLMAALAKTRPVILRLPIEVTGRAKIIGRDGRTSQVWMYDSELTGLVYLVQPEKGTNWGPHFGAVADREVVLKLLPTRTD